MGPAAVALLVALVAAAVVARLAVGRGRLADVWVWALRKGYLDSLGRLRPGRRPALPAAGPVPPPQRVRVRAQATLAAEIVAPYWPIATFIACNSLNGVENRPFEQATAHARTLTGGRGHLSGAHFRALYARGRITAADVDRALSARGPLAADTRPIDLGGRRVTASELDRLSLLHGLLGGPPPADPAERVGVDRTL